MVVCCVCKQEMLFGDLDGNACWGVTAHVSCVQDDNPAPQFCDPDPYPHLKLAAE